jgi:hypothetical protein
MNNERIFREALLAALVEHAAHHFEEAAHCAYVNGLQARTLLTNSGRTELCLSLTRPSDGAPCSYRIGALAERGLVLHEKIYGDEVERREASLESIRDSLVEDELAEFFIRATALPLGAMAELPRQQGAA